MFRVRASIPRAGNSSIKASSAWLWQRAFASAPSKPGTTQHWNAAKLVTTDKYPLSLELFDKMHPSTLEPAKRLTKGHARAKKGSSTTRHARTQLVSPDLCDDVLKHYGKNLDVHKGCDILDINPGAGLWSQKLHAYLQPRSHVLMEPNYDRFKPFLDPLLDAPDTKYKLIEKDTKELPSYTALIDEGVFPHQTRVDPEDVSGQELNPTLLVTGMLVWDPRLPGMSFDSMAKQLFNLFSSAVRTNDLFHAYGRVRTLFWVSTEDFKAMLAESAANFNKNNCLLEMSQDMEYVVSGTRAKRKVGRGSVGREPQYEIESAVGALQRARENGMTIPKHREDVLHQIANKIDVLTNGTGRCDSSWLNEYLLNMYREGNTPHGLLPDGWFKHEDEARALKEKYPDVDFDEMGNANTSGTRGRAGRPDQWRGREDHPARAEAHRFVLTKNADRALVKRKALYEAIADIGEELYHTECRALRTPPGPEKELVLQEVTKLEAKWDEELNTKLASNYKTVPMSILDDRLAMRSPPRPRLQWDRRTFEPITMREDEAWPPNLLSLVSSTPFPRPAGQTVDWYEWVQDFVYALFAVGSQPLPEALDKMQHGASQIIDSCPSLRDPDKGGRMNMRHLRVRLLTPEQIEELVQAYRDWPFKEPGSDHNKYFRWKGMSKGGKDSNMM